MRGTSGSLLILAMLGIAASGAARAEYPVSFNFFAGIPYELADPGNIVGQYFIKRLGGSGQVDKFVAIAAPWLGTYGDNMAMVRAFAARLGIDAATVDAAVSMGVCPACSEMLGGDPFMTALNADGVYDPTVAYTNLDTRYDELIVPYTIGLVPGPNVANFFMQDGCPIDYSDHLAIAGSHRGAMIALNALDPEHPRPVPCEFVPPLTG
ncbi:hypothetical protein ACFYTS_01730 [Nocardia sp. NPDC004151]|uniref:hypothetical protein n=1 Tax=Nocardia sp. NPDC004151 TaxID=3364304 RepID=UPI0036A186C6